MRTTAKRRRSAVPLLVLLVGSALGASGGCSGGEDVTPQALREARARWAKAGVRDYALEWASSGPRDSRYAVTVRDGRVRSVEAVAPDGRRYTVKPAEPRYYGVEGLFLTIADDLAQLDQPAPFNQPKGAKAVLRFTPDPDYGYPRRYRRDVLGAPATLAIDVVRFTPAAATRPVPSRNSRTWNDMKIRKAVSETHEQGRQWGRQAARYDELFLDAFDPGVESPLLPALAAVTDPGGKTVVDLGCGTGPLLPHLVGRFGRVVALDFAPAMLARARDRLGPDADRVSFLARPMHEIDDLAAEVDVAVAVNSLVMPDVRLIDRTLRAIRAAIKPGGVFLGVLPSIDAIHYHTMLLMDQSLDRGATPEEAERFAAFHAEHEYYEFAFGRFAFRGLEQKFWHPFEVRHRLTKAGFRSIELEQLLYPWDESLAGGTDFVDYPRSWDWSFVARP